MTNGRPIESTSSTLGDYNWLWAVVGSVVAAIAFVWCATTSWRLITRRPRLDGGLLRLALLHGEDRMTRAASVLILSITLTGSTQATNVLGQGAQPYSVPSRAAERLQIDADGHPLTVWVKRPVSARGSILLVHGRTLSALPNFDLKVEGYQRSVMDRFVERGFAAYALDQRGYGATPRDSSGWLTPNRAAKDVAIVLTWISGREGRSVDRPVLVGYSRGSQTSLLTAQLYQESLSKLVLYGFGRDLDTRFPIDEVPAEPLRERTTRALAASDFVTPGAAPQSVIDSYVRQALAADPIRVDWRNEHEFNVTDPGTIRVPTLLIHGVADPLATTDEQLKLFSRLGTADRSLVVLPYSDHAAHVEDVQPAWVDAIVTFIERPRVPVAMSR
jgi:pimeloyl-ACP methyl ester carboxylesterase